VSAGGEEGLEVRVEDVVGRLGSGGDGFGDAQASEGGAALKERVDGAAGGVVRPPKGGVQGLVHVLLHLLRTQLLLVLRVQPFAPRRP